jgi:hypothetical protein
MLMRLRSCLDWEYPERSLKALAIYQLFFYFFQPFFIPLLILLFWLRPWWKVSIPNSNFRFPYACCSLVVSASEAIPNLGFSCPGLEKFSISRHSKYVEWWSSRRCRECN